MHVCSLAVKIAAEEAIFERNIVWQSWVHAYIVFYLYIRDIYLWSVHISVHIYHAYRQDNELSNRRAPAARVQHSRNRYSQHSLTERRSVSIFYAVLFDVVLDALHRNQQRLNRPPIFARPTEECTCERTSSPRRGRVRNAVILHA